MQAPQDEDPEIEPEDALGVGAVAASRRDRLPDVEEVSEALRPAEPSRPVVDTAERRALEDVEQNVSQPSKGFARGFFLMILLAALAVFVYATAPQIAEAVPALAGALDVYVAQVDQGRAWLDGQVADLLKMLDGMSSESAAES